MKIRSSIRPQEIEITANDVLIASNITPYEEETDGHIIQGYEYECIRYSKDEYIAELAQELKAAKILLGVD